MTKRFLSNATDPRLLVWIYILYNFGYDEYLFINKNSFSVILAVDLTVLTVASVSLFTFTTSLIGHADTTFDNHDGPLSTINCFSLIVMDYNHVVSSQPDYRKFLHATIRTVKYSLKLQLHGKQQWVFHWVPHGTIFRIECKLYLAIFKIYLPLSGFHSDYYNYSYTYF